MALLDGRAAITVPRPGPDRAKGLFSETPGQDPGWSVTGNGSNNIVGSQYIRYDLSVSGNGSVTIVWTAAATANTRTIGRVE